MEIKITLPEAKITPEELEKKTKAWLTEDFEKQGILAKVLVFTYLYHPVSTTELTKKMSSYFNVDFDRATVYRALQKLNEKYIVVNVNTQYVLMLQEVERSPMHKKALEKYYSFLSLIPEQFKKRFQNVNYFWVNNSQSIKYVEWACRLLGFKYEKEKQKEILKKDDRN
jgi:hypothetical protein